VRVEKYNQKENRNFVVGRGWDQSLWGKDEFPINTKLNELFPKKPVNGKDYHRQSLLFHPDYNPNCKDRATAKFQDLNNMRNK
jgi:hypothetical protein